MKTTTADKIREREIRLIHVAKRELALDDDTYRAMLWAVARVKSAKELDWTGRKKVLDHLKAKGFKVKSKAAPGKAAKPNPDAADPQYRKIRALWAELHEGGVVRVNTDAAVRIYIKRMTGCDDYRFCNGHQVTTVIEALKKWIDRTGQPAAAATQTENSHG